MSSLRLVTTYHCLFPPQTAGTATKMQKDKKTATALSRIAHRQRAVHHAFFARARTSTLFRVRDKAMLFEPFPPQASTGCARSQQSRRCSFWSAPPRVSGAARTNKTAAVVHIQYLLRCVECSVFNFRTSKRGQFSLGQHAIRMKQMVNEHLSNTINSREVGPTLAIGWPTTSTGSTTNITNGVANRQH